MDHAVELNGEKYSARVMLTICNQTPSNLKGEI
jgi:hypothetical protein